MGLPSSPKSDEAAKESFGSLPQYGFATELAFDKLVEHNPFLFRVYTPKARAAAADDAAPFFLSPSILRDFGDAPDYFSLPVSSTSAQATPASPTTAGSAYADAALHLDWTTRMSSPYISTSFSFAWAVWEAARRYQSGVKHDVHIAIIDARQLVGRAVTALSLLRDGAPQDRHKDHWKWYRFASESQDVLVSGAIPQSAVLASMPLLTVLDKLPTYFLRRDVAEGDSKSQSPFTRLAWDHYTKPSFKQFSQDMSDQFSRLPSEVRMRESTAGSIRLALNLLQPWYHSKLLLDDFEAVVARVTELSLVIAQWPAQWWVRERAADLREIIRGMVRLVAEEVRETRRVQALREVERLQQVVADLERMANVYYKEDEPKPKPAPSPRTEPTRTSMACPTRPQGIQSTVLAGLWFGTVLTLSVFSSSRWELAVVT